MKFKPVRFPQGYGMAPNTTSWGGGVIYEPSTKKHHIYVSRMTNDCTLRTWTSNSRIDHAVSSTGPEGPYTFRDVAVNTWAHNAAPIALKGATCDNGAPGLLNVNAWPAFARDRDWP